MRWHRKTRLKVQIWDLGFCAYLNEQLFLNTLKCLYYWRNGSYFSIILAYPIATPSYIFFCHTKHTTHSLRFASLRSASLRSAPLHSAPLRLSFIYFFNFEERACLLYICANFRRNQAVNLSQNSENPGFFTVFRGSCSSALWANLISFFIFRSEYIFYTIEPIFVEFVQELFAIQSWKSEKPCFLTIFRVSCSSALWANLIFFHI